MDIGQLIAGRYRLREKAGSGGNGQVWRAQDEELDRTVAVKRALRGDGVQGSDQVRMLRREAKVLARLNHPNIITLYDAVLDREHWLLIMEYVPRHSLAEIGTVKPERAARIGVQLAAALEYAHSMDILHRDLKPSNVLVADTGHAKLGDFGSSRADGDDVTLTDSSHIHGTPGYLAPEVANGEEPTAASDVFSLGATLYAAVEGESPFGSSNNPLVLLRRTAAGNVNTPASAGDLAPILAALMTVDPKDRPTPAAARALLETVAEGTNLDTSFPPPPPPRRRPRRGLLIGGAAVVVAAAVAATLVALNNGGSGHAVATPGPPASVVGNPLTADPCALMDARAYARFGQADEENADGEFNRCDVMVQSGQSDVDVEVQLDLSQNGDAPSGPTQKVGSLTVVRTPSDSGECDRIVVLSAQYNVDASATQDGNGTVDLCAMADVATNGVIGVVSHGPIPRRTTQYPANSLINQNACTLFTPSALSPFPGVDALHPQPGFGNWDCQWQSTTSPAFLHVLFDQSPPADASDGTIETVGGHQAFVTDQYGAKTCEVILQTRQFLDSQAQTTDERLLVVVNGPQPYAQLCQWATAVAAPVAAKLPSP